MNIPLMTETQNKTLNAELYKVTDKPENRNVKIKYSPYSLDVYITYQRYIEGDIDVGLEDYYIRITPNGTIDRDPLRNVEFNSIADRMSFFNSLREP